MEKPEIIGKIDLDNSTTIANIKRTREGRMFKFEVGWQISEEQAINLQEQMGYVACSYGFYGFWSTPKSTHWYCGDSSD